MGGKSDIARERSVTPAALRGPKSVESRCGAGRPTASLIRLMTEEDFLSNVGNAVNNGLGSEDGGINVCKYFVRPFRKTCTYIHATPEGGWCSGKGADVNEDVR